MPERPWERVFRKEGGNLTVLSSFHHYGDYGDYGRRKRRVRKRSCCDSAKTHSEVSLLLKEAYPDRRGLSLRSVRRFCLKNGIHAQNRLSNDELEQCSGWYPWPVCVVCKKKLPFYLLLKKSKVRYFLEDVNTHLGNCQNDATPIGYIHY